MSTSTPIEIVRRYTQWREDGLARPRECPLEMGEVTIALASVLADAERFQALERAHDQQPGWQGWSTWSSLSGRQLMPEPLAELADRLRAP